MNASEFRRRGKEMVDYIADYMETIESRSVLPDVSPGYLRDLLPGNAPRKPEKWDDIMRDVDNAILPGITHWQHPRFHAYFPAGNSYPSILGDMLSDAIGCVGFSWAASPACTELEIIVMDWLAKMMGLPKIFLHESGIGGGVLQGSASECVLTSLLVARYQAVRRMRKELEAEISDVDDSVIASKLVAYCSKLAHSCVEKAGIVSMVQIRQLDTDDNYSLRGATLQKAIDEDRSKGLLPFYVCASLGTTSLCSFDNLVELGVICDKQDLWLHVDAAYAGSAFICPEFRHLMAGIEHACSFNFNPNKWLLVNFDCSAMWVNDRNALTTAMTVDPLYLRHHHSDKAIDFRHWGIPLSRRFRSLKLWFVIRSYGVEGLQKYIREHCRLASRFESLVRADERFYVVGERLMGLVCFRLKGPNILSQHLLRAINVSGDIYMVPAIVNDNYFIRFCVCAQQACDADIDMAWEIIASKACEVVDLCSQDENQDMIRTLQRIQTIVLETDEQGGKNSIDIIEECFEALKEDENVIEESDEFLFDNNIPSLPTMSTYKANGFVSPALIRRNSVVFTISDRRSYMSNIVKAPTKMRRRSESAESMQTRDQDLYMKRRRKTLSACMFKL